MGTLKRLFFQAKQRDNTEKHRNFDTGKKLFSQHLKKNI